MIYLSHIGTFFTYKFLLFIYFSVNLFYLIKNETKQKKKKSVIQNKNNER